MECISFWNDELLKSYERRTSKCINNLNNIIECEMPFRISLEKTVRDILGRNYDSLYNFFYNVVLDDAKYKILRARKCQVLFSIFLQIMFEKNIKFNGIFLSSHAVSRYKKDICATSALILDDILIHGRGLQDLYEELDPRYTNSNIRVFVYKMNRSADAMSREFKDKVKYGAKVFDWEWREISTQMAKVIHAVAEPYVSYVAAYSNTDDIDLEAAKTKFDVRELTDKDQKKTGTASYALFEKANVPPMIQSYGFDACVRYYINRNTTRDLYIPYVFMKNISEGEVKTFCNQMAEGLAPGFPALVNELRHDQNDNLDLQYKTYLMHVLLNHLYRLHIDKEYSNLLPISKCDLFTLAMCFGNDVVDEIARLTYDDVDENIWALRLADSQENTDIVSEDPELIEGLEGAIQETAETNPLLLYFYFDRQLDEKNAKRKRRKKGLPLKTFYDKLPGDIHDVGVKQLKCWDAGVAACYKQVCGNIGERQVCSYIRAGEQSFRYIMEILPKKNNQIDREALESLVESGSKETLKDRVIENFYRTNQDRLCAWR